jgi:hypothetical protein
MPWIFQKDGGAGPQAATRGRVVLLEGAPGAFQMEGWNVGGGNLSAFKSLVTDVAIQEQGNYQFLHNLGNHIYFYVFGDRIGQLGVSGVSLWSAGLGGGCDDNPADLGIIRVLRWYRTNRAVKRASPITATLGTQAFQAFLVGFRCSKINVTLRQFQFHLDLALLPDSSGL